MTERPWCYAQVVELWPDGSQGAPLLEAEGPLIDVLGELARVLNRELRDDPDKALDVTVYRVKRN
jgi:hypothetical protein